MFRWVGPWELPGIASTAGCLAFMRLGMDGPLVLIQLLGKKITEVFTWRLFASLLVVPFFGALVEVVVSGTQVRGSFPDPVPRT